MANYQQVSAEFLQYSAIITDPVSVDLSTGTVIVDYTDEAFYAIDVALLNTGTFTLQNNQIHVSSDLEINNTYILNKTSPTGLASIFTEGTPIYGTGTIYGTGDIV
jgi:hypothetical protein